MGILLLHPKNPSDIDANLDLNLDIIAIHGLNGDRERTWTEPQSHKSWLRDFLPGDLPRARIMVFGYDAAPVFASSTAGIEEHAKDLLRCLVEGREGKDEVCRPLIFIGHSLGGLVIKQAIVLAQHQRRWKNIYDSTKGVIFFGTPHQGSGMADAATIFARVASVVAGKPSPKLLKSLKRGNEVLEKLTEKFKKHHAQKPYDIVSFYETRTMVGWNTLVVETASALLTPFNEEQTYEEQIPVDATHRDMCRFSSSDDETYKTAVSRIKKLHMGNETKNAEVKNEHYIVPHTPNPHFTGRNDIRQKLNDSLIEDRYGNSAGQQRFVLYGLGGSGKTQVCLKFAENHKKKFWGVFWIDASSKETAEESFMHIARTCKQEARMDSVKEWLSRKEHWLLIIDNADDPRLDISRFFPLGSKGTVLVTTRNPDFQKFGSAGSCIVEAMALEDATTLLLNLVGLESVQEKEKKLAEQVVKSLGCLALAIIQAGAVIRQCLTSLEGFCDLYSQRKKELLESGRPESSIDYQHSVYTTWEISIKLIEDMHNDHAELALELLRLFSFMHFEGITERIFKDARSNPIAMVKGSLFSESVLVRLMPTGWDPLLVGHAIRILVSFSLITVDEGRRISMHPLVHEFSRSRLLDERRKEAWMTTLVTISTATTFGFGYEDMKQRRPLLPHIDACLSHSDDHLFSPGLFQEDRVWAALKFSMAYRESHRNNAIDLSSRSLELVESIFPPGSSRHIYTMRQVAYDLTDLGRRAECLELRQKILEYVQRTGVPDDIADSMVCLANVYRISGQLQEAIDLCNDAIEKFQSQLGEGNHHMLIALEIIGAANLAMKRRKNAARCLEKALEIRKKTFGEQSYHNILPTRELSDLYLEMSKYKKARVLQQEHVRLLVTLVGPDDIRTITAMSDAENFQNRGFAVRSSARRRTKTIAFTKRKVGEYRDMKGDMNTATFDLMGRLVLDYFMCGSLENARDLQEEIVELTIQRWGKDSPFAIDSMARLKSIQRTITLRKAFYWWVPKTILEKDRLRI